MTIQKQRHFREAGYTLFEIMLVLGIISVLVSAAIYSLAGNIDVAKEQRVTSDIQAISMQLRTYEMLNFRKPTTEQGLQALVQPPNSDPKPQRWKKLMETLPVDPWGNPYVYMSDGRSQFSLLSLGRDGKEGGEGVDADISL